MKRSDVAMHRAKFSCANKQQIFSWLAWPIVAHYRLFKLARLNLSIGNHPPELSG